MQTPQYAAFARITVEEQSLPILNISGDDWTTRCLDFVRCYGLGQTENTIFISASVCAGEVAFDIVVPSRVVSGLLFNSFIGVLISHAFILFCFGHFARDIPHHTHERRTNH